MTAITKDQLITHLRAKRKELEATLEAVTAKVVEWDKTHQRDKHAAPSIVTDLEQLLGLEGEP